MSNTALYITFDGLSDPLGQSQILPYLRGLAQKGYVITILSCEKPSRLQKEKSNIENTIKGLPLHWEYIIYDEAGGIFSRWRYVQQLRSLAQKIRIKNNITLTHCRSYLAALIGLEFKRKHQIPFIFDMRGFWADERKDGKIWSQYHPLHILMYRYFKIKERDFLKHADALVSLTTAGVKELSTKNKDLDIITKSTVIPCCTDTTVFDPAQIKTLAGSGKPDHLIIYTGSIGTWYYTKEMVDCMLVWKKQIPNLKLLVVTRDHEALEKVLKPFGSSIQNFISSVAARYEQVPEYLKTAKASLFFIKPAYSKIASSPTKMAESWSMDIPIITNTGIGDNDFIFDQFKGGVLIKEFTDKEYENACRRYLALSRPEGHYRHIAIQNFDVKTAVERYEKIYKRLYGSISNSQTAMS